ncbi:MAG TPA: hypothetical protein VFM77_06945 [Terriglobales bacterium]|nr:hypothetical protein [Terriglobales bacterium]
MMPLSWRLIGPILRLRRRLEVWARQLTVVLWIRRWTVVLRARLAAFFPARLPIFLPGLLNIGTRHAALLIVAILR